MLSLFLARDTTGHTLTKQFYDLGEQINGANYYYSKDFLGSVRELTVSSGVVQANYDYDIYGRQVKLLGDVDSDFGYTGFYIEKAVCLDLTWYRAYDAEKGRWLSRDPLAEKAGMNLYEYVKDDPLLFVDPDGRGNIAAGACELIFIGIAWTLVCIKGPINTGTGTPWKPKFPGGSLDDEVCIDKCRIKYPCNAFLRTLCIVGCVLKALS